MLSPVIPAMAAHALKKDANLPGERPSVAPTRDRAELLGCAIDRLDMGQTVARCKAIIERRTFAQQVSINAAKLVTLQRDSQLRDVVNRCALVNADGQAVVWASRLLGDSLPERVAGIDLMHELIGLAEQEGYGIYILGARSEVLSVAIECLQRKHPKLRIAGHHHGWFAEEESPRIAAAIRDSDSQILFVAMSSPRKEYWLSRYGPDLNVPLVMGVGGSIDIVAGVTRRAPRAWQRLGIEWLFRLLQEPRRMLPRYLVTNVQFCALIARGVSTRALNFTLGRIRPIQKAQ